MSALRQSLADYLSLRRELGFKLDRAGRLLAQFVDFCDESGAEVVTVALALAWATMPEDCSPAWGSMRLCVLRGLPATCTPSTLGPVCPDEPAARKLRAIHALPVLVGPGCGVDDGGEGIRSPLRAATTETIVGLLASAGLRIGEALALDRSDVDLGRGL